MIPLTQEQRELAENNRGLAWRVANQFHRPGRGEDARQELGAIALLALCEAAQGFDPARGYTFATYATIACRQAIQDERRSGGLIHTPCYLSHASNIGHRYRVHRDHVREAEHNPGLLADLVAPMASIVQQAEADELRDRVRRLPRKHRHIIERVIEGWTTTEIGHEMGCTRQHINDLVQAARARLRKVMK